MTRSSVAGLDLGRELADDSSDRGVSLRTDVGEQRADDLRRARRDSRSGVRPSTLADRFPQGAISRLIR
jgi:hypothetical protein